MRGRVQRASPEVVCQSDVEHPSTPPTVSSVDNATLAAFLMHERAVESQGRGILHFNMLLLLADVAQVVSFFVSGVAYFSFTDLSAGGGGPF